MKKYERSVTEFHPEVWSPRPGKWEVTIGPWDNGWVNNRDRKCQVPYPYGVVQEHIRIHEAYHVLISPEEAMGMTERMLEEVRVHGYAYHRYVDMDYCHDLVPRLKPNDSVGEQRNAAWWICQFAPTGFEREELCQRRMTRLKWCPEGVEDHVSTALEAIDEARKPGLFKIITDVWNNPTNAQRKTSAEEFDNLFPPNEERGEGDASDPGVGATGDATKQVYPRNCGSRHGETVFYEGKDGERHPYKDGSRSATRKRMDAENQEAGVGETEAKARHGTWTHKKTNRDREILETQSRIARQHEWSGSMAIEKVILPANKTFLAQSPGGEVHKGEEIVQIGRLWTDRQIFRGRKAGGSVVIDVSGSMSWDWNALRDAVREMPSTTIGIYGGMYSTDKDGYTIDECNRHELEGRLIIIADKGRWADPAKLMEASRFTGGNDVDIEAVEWLAKQQAPRVWLSDGAVCGGQVGRLYNTKGRGAVRERFNTICRQAHIVRTTDVDAAVEYIRSRGRQGIAGVETWQSKTFLNVNG